MQDQLQKHQRSAVQKVLESSPDTFGEEYIESNVEATKQVAYAIGELVSSNTLTPIQGARTIAAAVSFGVWGLDEFIAGASPGPTFNQAEFLMGSRGGVLSPSN